VNGTVISNLRSLIEISGSLSGARALADPGGLWACDSGTGSAYENYALLSPSADEGRIDNLVASGLGFFGASETPHIWPIFPDLPERVKTLLERGGARREDVFFGMTADLPQEPFAPEQGGMRGVWISGKRESRDWADAAWYGFDSGEPAPDSFASFVSFASNISLRGEISLFGLLDPKTGIVAATGLLCESDGIAGIYYVSTRPEFRRRGLGLRVMKSLMARGLESGCRIACLIATPAGRPLYLKCGFKESCRIEIMIHEGRASGRGDILR
jgi:GNAT superfamily N-acetyltransferase